MKPAVDFNVNYPRDNVNHPDVRLLFHYLEGRADLFPEEKHPMEDGEIERYAEVFGSLIADPAAARGLAGRGRDAAREFDWPDLTRMFLGEVEKLFNIGRE